jgi:F-type H+-transporting ATPase subunit delta
VSIGVVGKRYARALLQIASEQNAIERIGRELREFVGSYQQSRDLRAVFENPGVPQQSRAAILRDIAAQSGMHDQTRDLLLLLADRQRLVHVDEVSEAFDALAEARSGTVRAEVRSATELPTGYFTELQTALRAATGREVVVVHKVDPSLIAGVVAKVGDQVFDGSVKSQLAELRDELLRREA